MEIFTVDQAAEILALCPKTIRDMLNTGRMHGSKIGGKWRILQSDIDELMASNAGMSIQPNINAQSSVQFKLKRDVKEEDHFCPFLSVAQRERVACDMNCALYITGRRGDGTCSIAILAKKN